MPPDSPPHFFVASPFYSFQFGLEKPAHELALDFVLELVQFVVIMKFNFTGVWIKYWKFNRYFLYSLVIFLAIGEGVFAEEDPKHFGNFWTTGFTLIQLLTLDDWYELFTGITDKLGMSNFGVFASLLKNVKTESW